MRAAARIFTGEKGVLANTPALRDGADAVQLLADERDGMSNEIAVFMQHAHPNGAASCAAQLPGHSLHEHGTAADGLAVVAFVVKAQIEIPPVVNQGDEVGHEAAGRELAGGEAVPSHSA